MSQYHWDFPILNYPIVGSLTIGSLTLGCLSVGIYYGKSYLERYIANKVIDQLKSKQDNEGIVFQALERTNSAVILYKHGGKEHRVCVPYDRSKSTAMLRKQVFLINSSNNNNDIDKKIDINRIEITHKPGIPYLLSAKQMGGTKIIVIKDNETIKEYLDDDIPGYLE